MKANKGHKSTSTSFKKSEEPENAKTPKNFGQAPELVRITVEHKKARSNRKNKHCILSDFLVKFKAH